jgi:hypothetical protein
MGDNSSTTFNDFHVDGCNISEVILFLQNLALSPNASSMNVAFTKHITNALMQIREDKLKQKVSIPKKLEDGWEPIIEMNVNEFDCNALCDLGASISIRDFYFCALGSLVVLSFPQLLSFSSVFPKPLSETLTRSLDGRNPVQLTIPC